MRSIPRLALLGPAILGTLFAASAARAAWPTNPAINVPVSATSGTQWLPAAAPDSCGGMILAWQDARASSGQALVYVQRVDAFGQPRWTVNGFAVAPTAGGVEGQPSICTDDAGGAFVTWNELRVAATGRDVYVQHVLSGGIVDPAWPADGLQITNLTANQQAPEIVADGVGGAIVVWSDDGGNVDFRPDLYAQRVSPLGTIIWAANGVPLVVEPGEQSVDHAIRSLASDGGGGVIAAWRDVRSGVGQAMAQRLAGPTGAPMWTPGGVVVAPTFANQNPPAICADGARAVLTWEDARVGPLLEGDVYAQALSPGGALLWAPGGVPVCTAVNRQYGPKAVTDRLGGVIIAWTDARAGYRSDENVFAQRLDAAGTPLWAPNGLGLCTQPGIQSTYGVISDERNGAIVVWVDGRFGVDDIYAQRVGPTGTPLWTPEGQAVSKSAGESRPVAVPDGAGGVVSAWEDSRSWVTNEFDLYAQEVGATGSVGVRAASKNCMPDICGYAYVDFGDAPEGIAAYVSGSPGHFPTCLAPGSPGTQEIDCGAALSTPPGPTGYVRHDGTNPNTPSIGLGCSPLDAAGHAVVSYKADLAGSNVSPPNGSPALGSVNVDIDRKAHTMRIHATFSGLLGTTTASHIHAATTVALAGNAGVATMTPSFVGFPIGVTAGTYDHTFDMTLASSYNPTFVTSHGGIIAQAESDLLQSFADGKAYFCTHSTAFGGGEIRGFLVPSATAPTLAVDTELDGTVNAVGAPPAIIPSETSTCSPAVAIYEYERGGGGLWFGADEIEGDGDAGISKPVALTACDLTFLPYKAWNCATSTIAAYLNVLADWNQDGDWNDVVSCVTGTNVVCVPEWAVKNAQVQLAPGCNALSTPTFNTGPIAGQPWMRMTLTLAPVGDEFPWAGSANIPGGSFAGGESEDYPLTVAATVLAVGDVPVPSVLALGTIWPNPIRETAEIQFSLAHAGRATIDLYDLTGRRVRSVIAGTFTAGRHVARWDGRNAGGTLAPSGFYFARLTSDGRTISRPLIRLN